MQHEFAKKEHAKTMGQMINQSSWKDNDSDGPKTWREKLKAMVHHHSFNALAAAVLVGNVLLLGIQVEYLSTTETENPPLAFLVLDGLACLFFVGEMGLRMLAEGLRSYFTSEDGVWNIVDFSTITFGSVEFVISLVSLTMHDRTTSVRVLRLLRLARVVRIVRIIRVGRFFHSLRILVGAMLGTMKSCIWTSLLLLIIMYSFGMVFAQATYVYSMEHTEDNLSYDNQGWVTSLHCYWGSLTRSIFTLFMAVVGGLDWGKATYVLSNVSPSLVALFIVYILFVSLVVLNVVTGIFLQSAIEQASQDSEHVISQQLKANRQYEEKLKGLFEELDASGDGNITLVEFEHYMGEEKMMAFLQSLEINASDAWTFFKLLDVNTSGSLTLEEFVTGCFRLKGNAKSIHVAQIMYENQWIMNQLSNNGLDGAPPLWSDSRAGSRYSKNSLFSYSNRDSICDSQRGSLLRTKRYSKASRASSTGSAILPMRLPRISG
jgi:hypothetical protein